jgi:hypothetical protein
MKIAANVNNASLMVNSPLFILKVKGLSPPTAAGTTREIEKYIAISVFIAVSFKKDRPHKSWNFF